MKKNVIKYSEWWFKARRILLVCLHLPLLSAFVNFPLLMSISGSLSLSYTHTQNPTPHPHLCLCCCVWLVSGATEWRVGAPWSPRGQPEAPRISREARNGASRSLPAPLIADFFLPFEICALTCSMCSYAPTTTTSEGRVLCLARRCTLCRLPMLSTVSSGDVASVLLGVFTVVHFCEETTSTHRQGGPTCSWLYVFTCGGWVTIWNVFVIAGVDAWC